MTSDRNQHYSAFISYSHKDERWGKWLYSRLVGYSFPKSIRNSYKHPKRLGRIFKDREKLATSADLKEEIKGALAATKSLVVICSTNSAESEYVNDEIVDYHSICKGRGTNPKIACLIIEGEPNAHHSDKPYNENFPPALRSNQASEPLAADVRKDGKWNALLKVIAGITGIKYDDLTREHFKRRRRRIVYWLLFAAFFTLLTAFLLWKSIISERKAVESYIDAQSNYLTLSAVMEQERNPTLSFRLAEIALQMRPDNFDAKKALITAYYKNQFYSIIDKYDHPFTAAQFSPDGSKIVAGTADGFIMLYDKNGTRLLKKKVHHGKVSSVDFSPDGALYVTSSYFDPIVKVWAGKGRLVMEFDNSKGNPNIIKDIFSGSGIISAQFSPDGKQLLIACRNDSTAKVIDLQGNIKRIIKGSNSICRFAKYCPTGEYILTKHTGSIITSDSYSELYPRLWNKQGQIEGIFSLPHLEYAGTGFFFLEDGNTILIPEKNRLNFYDYFGNLIYYLDHPWINENSFFQQFGDEYWFIDYKESNNEIVISMIILENNNVLHPIFHVDFWGHSKRINSICLSPDQRHFLTTSDDNTLRMWNIYPKSNIIPGLGKHISFAPDFSYFLTYGERHSNSGTVVKVFNKRTELISRFTFGNPRYVGGERIVIFDENKVLAANMDGILHLLDFAGKPIWEIRTDIKIYNDFVFHEKHLLVNELLFDENEFPKSFLISIVKGSIDIKGNGYSSLSRNGKHFAIANDSLTLYDVENMSYSTLRKSIDVTGVFIMPDNQSILLTFKNKPADVINLKGEFLYSIPQLNGRTEKVVFSNTGRFMVTIRWEEDELGGESLIELWKTDGTFINKFKEAVSHIDFSDDDQYVLLGCTLYDIQGREIIEFAGEKVFFFDGDRNILTIPNGMIWKFQIEDILNSVNNDILNGNVWQLDQETRVRYGIKTR